MNKILLAIALVIGFLLAPTVASAALQLDSVTFDPAIITAGDDVDIVVQYHDEATGLDDDMINNPDYSFKVLLEADDTLTKEYVQFQDAEGDDVSARVFAGGYYNKIFRIKVFPNAPAGRYQFKLSGQWYYNDEPVDAVRYLRFTMNVKKQGIILNAASLETVPAEVRPGDNYVKILANIENAGEKDAKSVELTLDLPAGLTASYSDNNRVWVGLVKAGETKQATFFVDVDDDAKNQIYQVKYNFNYMDLDNNKYEESQIIPFLVKPRPYLEVVNFSGSGKAGDTSKLYVTVKNTGTESAEAVDVRVLKQNSQPFGFDVRSDYIGELEPGEEGLAVFDISVNSDAEIKTHDFKLLIRSKGDSDEGDDNIYTYNRRAAFEVTGTKPNHLLTTGVILLVLVLIIVVVTMRRKK